MSTISDEGRILFNSFTDREYREATVEANVRRGIAFQIHEMRELRGWTQEDLAARSGKQQEAISRLENPNYGSHSLKTLMQMAATFDVALVVRFVPFSAFAELLANLSPEDLAIPDYDEDRRRIDEVAQEDPASPHAAAEHEHSGLVVGSWSGSVRDNQIVQISDYLDYTFPTRLVVER